MKVLALLLLCLICVTARAEEPRPVNSGSHFLAVDIYLDPQDQPLAAYQLEFHVTSGVARIVGIEGGAHPAFAEPPFYDPAAIQHERVILAGFNTGADRTLPTRKTRIATVHLQRLSDQPLRPVLKVERAATVGGINIKIVATCEERKPK